MKQLVVMRHGKAARPVPDQNDLDRSLTEAGTFALDGFLPHMLRLLEAKGRTAEIWTSSAKRAHQTACLLEKALREKGVSLAGKVEAHDSLLAQDVDWMLSELDECDTDIVFAVGHVPFVEDVTERLVGSAPHFSTGALCCLELDPRTPAGELDGSPAHDARLLWFVQGPKAADWETLEGLEDAMSKKVEAIRDRREAFFADPEDIETIHRFRTHIRSLRSLVAFVKPWQKGEQNAETQTLLRDIVRYTSRLRELDVFERQVRENPDSSPALRKYCRKKASSERKRVLGALSSKQVTKAFERAMELAGDVEWKRRYLTCGLPQGTIRARFDAMVDSCVADLDALRLSDPERTHDVRKRAKRARYVSELCGQVLGSDAAGIAKGMNAHQDNLGEVCDVRANIRLVNEFLEEDLPETVVWELKMIRAKNETYLYGVLRGQRTR